MQRQVLALIASSTGNLLEWYDFGLFSSFALIFAQLFFPDSIPAVALVKVFGIYALGFLCRPLGALLFGIMGDHKGRAKTLRASILLISLPTFLIAFVPSFQTAGILGPVLLVCLRLIQGISLGGEFTGTLIYLTEIAPPRHRALYASLAGTIANLGFLAANGIAFLLRQFMSPSMFTLYGWRVAFIIGGLIGLLILYLRRMLIETSTFVHLQEQHRIVPTPFMTALKQFPRKMLLVVGLAMLGAVFYYTWFIYLFNLLPATQLAHSTVELLQSLCLGCMLILVPLGGWVCDLLGRRYSFFIVAGGVFSCAWLCFHWITSGHLGLTLTGLGILTVLSSLEQATTSVTVVEQVPAVVRYTALSVSYNLTQAIFGGTGPLIAAWLVFVWHNPTAPAFYLMVIAAITFGTSFLCLKDTRQVNLEA